MTYFQAMTILDRLKDGHPYPDHIITQALKLTGDIDES